MEDKYNGKCPICSGQLQVDGEKLLCVNGDYECARTQFERRWLDFDQDLARLKKAANDAIISKSEFENMLAQQSEQLLKDLQALNTVRSVTNS